MLSVYQLLKGPAVDVTYISLGRGVTLGHLTAKSLGNVVLG